MAKRIIQKLYYRITFTLVSPLSIGSGENRYTDRDIIRDSSGEPYIPASAIAGVCRSLFPHENGDLTGEAKPYFGYVKIRMGTKEEEDEQAESTLIFYDAKLLAECRDKYYVSVRDSVKLDDFKTAVDGAKFDMEVLEPGVQFRTYLEQSLYADQMTDYAALVVGQLYSDGALFGAKSMRGYGSIRIDSVERCTFDLTKSDQIDQWIEFDLYEESSDGKPWKPLGEKEIPRAEHHRLCLSLRQAGGISIRKYTTQVSTEEETKSDFTQLTLHKIEDEEPVPVIPGTSWAGAIRHRMRDLGLTVEDERFLFGDVITKASSAGSPAAEEPGGRLHSESEASDSSLKSPDSRQKTGEGGMKQKSRLRFGESRIHGASRKVLSRNAIDRFSGGTVNGALFTEETYYGGETQLEISWFGENPISEKMADLLAAALSDLHYGFLAVGGETSIGRGLFEVEAVNGTSFTDQEKDNIYPVLQGIIRSLWAKRFEPDAGRVEGNEYGG